VPVSSGFVARALERLAQRLTAAGFDEAMKAALRAEDVLCADETPTNVISKNTDEHGQPVAGSAHAVTVRTPDARLVWYVAIGSGSKTDIAALGVLEGYAGYLVRDDYAGWHQFDTQLAGVQQCAAHLIRHVKGVLELHPTQQNWAGQVITVLREAAAAVTKATTDQRDPHLLADLRQRYEHAVRWGIITNRHRDWPRGNYPGYDLVDRGRARPHRPRWAIDRRHRGALQRPTTPGLDRQPGSPRSSDRNSFPSDDVVIIPPSTAWSARLLPSWW
jgi:Transposase IS66 family